MTTEERLEKLEKQLMRRRRFNCWLLAGLGLVIMAWIVGWAFRPRTATTQPTSDIVREVVARKFTLVDENGNPRIVLIASTDETEIQLLKANGKTGAWLNASNRGSLLQLNDENGNYRLGLHVFKDGPNLDLCDDTMIASGKPRVEIYARKDGPKVQLYDTKGNILWKAP